MRNDKSPKALVGALLLLITAILVVTSSVTKERSFLSLAQNRVREIVLPIADYQAQEPADPQEKLNRHNTSKRYDRQSSDEIKEASYPLERIWSTYWWKDISAVPVRQSDLVVIGDVIDAQAYLSTDRTAVYSEFGVRVEEVLKGKDITAANHPVISTERFGGAVRFPSGAIQRYRTRNQGMPKPGRRYILFLKRLDQGDGFSLLTGYEVRGERVAPLDGSETPGERLPFDSYENAELSSFLKVVQDALLQDPTESPTPGY